MTPEPLFSSSLSSYEAVCFSRLRRVCENTINLSLVYFYCCDAAKYCECQDCLSPGSRPHCNVCDVILFLSEETTVMGEKKGILPSIHAHIKVHLLVCKSQETFQAGVSCCCQGLPVPLQPDGLQPRTHRPLWHTHLRYD